MQKKIKEIGLTIDEIFKHGSQLIIAMYGAAITFRKPNIPDEQKWSTAHMIEGYRYRMYPRDFGNQIWWPLWAVSPWL